MRTVIRFVLMAGLLASLLAALSCGKDEEYSQQFNKASDENFERDMSDLSSFKLSNGATVYLQEERTSNEVAIEAVYRAGYTRDPKGRVQIAHLTEHLTMHCATGPYKAGDSMQLVKDKGGKIAAEALADFIHVDYVVDAANLDEALAIEASRLKELSCDQATLEAQKKMVAEEFPNSMKNPRGNLTRISLAALAQIIYYGQTHVPVNAGIAKLTLDDVHRFHQANYRPDDMVLVMIGNFKKTEAEALVRKHFEPIPSRPTPPEPALTIRRSTRATWDIPVNATYFIAPGPYQDEKERLILTMFGGFLQGLFANSPDVYGASQATYTSNQTYPVGRLPFFIFVQAKEGSTADAVVPALFARVDQAIQALDEDKTVEMVKTGMISFVTTSGLQPDEPDFPMLHYQVIGQEALNVCLKHMVLDGRTTEDFAGQVNSITPDEFRAVVKKRLDRSALLTISIDPRT
jgi:predicted Zn-dependent peptidase